MAELLKAALVYDSLKDEIKKNSPKHLGLASVRIGEDYASQVYFSQQEKLAKDVGIDYKSVHLPGHVTLKQLAKEVVALNDDKKIKGVVINKPFPREWREEDVFSLIDTAKDIEGMNPYNLGLLFTGRPRFISPTVRSVLKFIEISKVDLRGAEVTLVGASLLIGKPLAIILANLFATVRLTHVATFERAMLEHHVKAADVVVTSVGKPDLIKGAWIKKGAVVVDVGIGHKDGKICGDVEFDAACKHAAFITPVPGGVGRLTTLFLFENLLKAAGKI